MVKPQDVVVACKLLVAGPEWTYARLSASVALSAAETHASVRRLGEAGVARVPPGGGARVRRREALELLLAAPKIYCGEVGAGTGAGTPTSLWADPLRGEFEVDPSDEPVVWASPYPELVEPGQVRGRLLEPLYPTVPRAIRGDRDLWRLLALLDVLRVGEPEHARRAAALLRKRVLEEG